MTTGEGIENDFELQVIDVPHEKAGCDYVIDKAKHEFWKGLQNQKNKFNRFVENRPRRDSENFWKDWVVYLDLIQVKNDLIAVYVVI